MLTDDIKQAIQGAYTRFLEQKGLKARYGQRLMIAEVARGLGNIETGDDNERSGDPAVVVVEAGTGTGKTVAYSLAAIPVARAAEKRLVIATATVALQEQIVNKDLPDIIKNSGLKFSYALAKGRGAICACRGSITGSTVTARSAGRPTCWPNRATISTSVTSIRSCLAT